MGNESAPWDIGSALDGKRKVEPGDTLWIHQGRYKAEPKVGGMGYVVRLAGRDGAPVQVRAWKGQRLLAARQCLHSERDSHGLIRMLVDGFVDWAKMKAITIQGAGVDKTIVSALRNHLHHPADLLIGGS